MVHGLQNCGCPKLALVGNRTRVARRAAVHYIKSSSKCKLWDFSIFFSWPPTLRPYKFYPPAPKLTYDTCLESPNIFLYEKFKKIVLKAFLSSFLNTQINLVSYHKTIIVPVSLWLAVSKLHYLFFEFWLRIYIDL